MSKVLILSGDGIGQEIITQALKVIDCLNADFNLNMTLEHGLVGGSAYDETGSPLPQATLDVAHECDSILLGAVGGYQWESLARDLRPERGLLGLRR
jgi:3-isopropylmalate dehydrogenase